MQTMSQFLTPSLRVRASTPIADSHTEEVEALHNLDPFGFDAGDPNLYRYVGNGPTNGVDPSGLDGVGAPINNPQGYAERYMQLKKEAEEKDRRIAAEIQASKTRYLQKETELLRLYEQNGVENFVKMSLLMGHPEGQNGILDAGLHFKLAAERFATDIVAGCVQKGGYSAELQSWIENAARHYHWQMMLTIRYGDDVAKLIGDWHETGTKLNIDRMIDTHHNTMARKEAASLRKDFLKVLAETPSLKDKDPLRTPKTWAEEASLAFAKKESFYKRAVEEITWNLIDDAVKRRGEPGKLIVYPDDPYITEVLKIPLTLPGARTRPGWPPPRR